MNECAYRIHRLGRFPQHLPTSLRASFLIPVGPRIIPAEVRFGIRISDPFPASRAEFVAAVTEALELIRASDSLRFARVRREIRVILNCPGLTWAAYHRSHRICRIDLDVYPLVPDRRNGIIFLACSLIHEATHGHLHTRRIANRDRDYARIENICTEEEIRFGRKFGLDLSRLEAWQSVPDGARPPTTLALRRFARGEKEKIRSRL